MDWFNRSFAAAQSKTLEAAEKTKLFAQAASVQANVAAKKAGTLAQCRCLQAAFQDAAEKTRIMAQTAGHQLTAAAEQTRQQAMVLAAAAATEAEKLRRMASEKLHVHQNVTAAADEGTERASSDVDTYGISPDLLTYVSTFSYGTFSDFDATLYPSFASTVASTAAPDGTAPLEDRLRLSAWQEEHARLVLQSAQQLQGLRFALCPQCMSDQRFWLIYFTLTRHLLPSAAYDFRVEDLESLAEAPCPVVPRAATAAASSPEGIRPAQTVATTEVEFVEEAVEEAVPLIAELTSCEQVKDTASQVSQSESVVLPLTGATDPASVSDPESTSTAGKDTAPPRAASESGGDGEGDASSEREGEGAEGPDDNAPRSPSQTTHESGSGLDFEIGDVGKSETGPSSVSEVPPQAEGNAVLEGGSGEGGNGGDAEKEAVEEGDAEKEGKQETKEEEEEDEFDLALALEDLGMPADDESSFGEDDEGVDDFISQLDKTLKDGAGA